MTRRTYAELQAQLADNDTRQISPQDVREIAESIAIQTGIIYTPSPVTINTVADVTQQIPLNGIGFNPPTGGMSVVGGAMNLLLTGRYICSYRMDYTPSTGAAITTLQLYYDVGGGSTFLDFSDLTQETAGGSKSTISGSYVVYAPVPNTKIALHVKTAGSGETLTNCKIFASFIYLPNVQTV